MRRLWNWLAAVWSDRGLMRVQCYYCNITIASNEATIHEAVGRHLASARHALSVERLEFRA